MVNTLLVCSDVADFYVCLPVPNMERPPGSAGHHIAALHTENTPAHENIPHIYTHRLRRMNVGHLLTRQQMDASGSLRFISRRQRPACRSHEQSAPSLEELICDRRGRQTEDTFARTPQVLWTSGVTAQPAQVGDTRVVRIYRAVWSPSAAGDPVFVAVKERLGENRRGGADVPHQQGLKTQRPRYFVFVSKRY